MNGMKVYVKVGLAARQAAVARTGSDPSEWLPLDLATEEWSGLRGRIAPRLKESEQGGALPGRSLYVSLPDTTDVTPEAILSALDALDALDAERDRRQKERNERKEQLAAEEAKQQAASEAKRKAFVEQLSGAPLESLVESSGSSHYYGDLLTGSGYYDMTSMLEEAGRLAEVQAELARRRKIDADAKEEERLKVEAERVDWIGTHGSTRLQRLVVEKIECGAVYRDERFKHERPGWRWYMEVEGSEYDPRNCGEEDLDLLDAARESLPAKDRGAVKLHYWKVYDDLNEVVWTGYVALSTFMDDKIVFGGPKE